MLGVYELFIEICPVVVIGSIVLAAVVRSWFLLSIYWLNGSASLVGLFVMTNKLLVNI